MTEPMTARERAQELEEAYRIYRDKRLATLAEHFILADRAAERARLAQSGDVEGLSRELYEVVHEGLQVDLKGAWERENPRVINAMGRLARHVQAKLAATAEAVEDKAMREAIEVAADSLRVGAKVTGAPELATDRRRCAEIIASLTPEQIKKRIRALRPDELEKKT